MAGGVTGVLLNSIEKGERSEGSHKRHKGDRQRGHLSTLKDVWCGGSAWVSERIVGVLHREQLKMPEDRFVKDVADRISIRTLFFLRLLPACSSLYQLV
jgi:hypothetical protein